MSLAVVKMYLSVIFLKVCFNHKQLKAYDGCHIQLSTL